jgi:predicted ATPase
MSVAASVASALEGRSRLLVFDNCEHVLGAAADMIEAILARSSTVGVLTTSREGLRLADEQLWPVPSLDVLAGVDSAAATLFLQRAGSLVAPGIALTRAEAGAVVEICGRLDGIPLAIELAASRMQSMTVTELRDRLADRFRLLVGSRRGLERHQTLRHAVAWSYDLLDGTEKTLLTRCSVFAGGFDLTAAQAVGGCGDDLATLEVLDALVRKSLIVADRSSGRTRFSMLETIRQFAEEQLVGRGVTDEVRAAHARYFAGRETDVLALWDSTRQREAYTWFTVELANLRTALRWAADQGDLDTAAAIATHTTFLGVWVEQYEPVAWAEELIEPAKAVDHRRLLQLYVAAAQCYAAGRAEDAFGYLEASQQLTNSAAFDPDLYEAQTATGIAYMAAGRPQRWVEVCRSAIAQGPGPHAIARACLVMALYFLGDADGARLASEGLLSAADATDNPNTACFALVALGMAHRDTDPVAAFDVERRAAVLARESGNRQMEMAAAVNLSAFAAAEGDPGEAFDYLTTIIRRYHDSGSVSLLQYPMPILAALFDRVGRHEQAATICGFVGTDMARAAYPQIDATIAHLRRILDEQTYESLAHAGKSMTNAAMATYALDHIDQARAELKAIS